MTPLETLTLGDPAAASFAAFAPSRGGILTRLTLGGRALLYLDEATLLDPTKNVRGGNPVLFPSPGKLFGDRWSKGAMGQHGFARNQPWTVLDRSQTEATLRLAANDATRAVYPYEFTATYRYLLGDRSLLVEQRIENHGPEPMPFGAGFHPYFAVPQLQKGQVVFHTNATRVFDNVTKETRPIGAVDFTAKEVDLHLLDHGQSEATVELPGGLLHVRCSTEFKRWVLWTVQDKDFVCVEPWTSPGNALNTGEDLLHAPPSGAITLRTEYAV